MSLRKWLLLLVLAAAAPARAEPVAINETRPLNAEGRVRVNNLAGLIEVTVWDKHELRLTGELGEGVEKLEISGSAAELDIEVKLPKRSRSEVEDSVLRLRVPAGARLELEGVSSDIVVQGLRGRLSASSVSGDVTLNVDSAEVEAQTVSGELSLNAPKAKKAELSSVSGDVQVAGVRERLQVETVSGDVRVARATLNALDLKSVSGDFNAALGLGAAPQVNVETMSGYIVLELAATPDAELGMRTFSGELQSEFGPAIPEDKRRYETRLGSGKGRIELNSFSGDITLRKR